MNHSDSLVCPICRQTGMETIMSGLFDDRFGAPGFYDIVRCRHCGMEQTWPRPTESELKELYEQYYNWGGEQGTIYTRVREWLLLSPLYRLWLRVDGDLSFHLRRGAGHLLDIGCNEGRGLVLYAQNGFQAEGLELNENAAAVARAKGFRVYTGALERLAPAEPFDVVVLSNVIEHLPDPVAALQTVHWLLRPGGQVWISCPNGNSLWRRIFGRRWINYHVPFHLWHFSPDTLREILTRADFRIVEIQTLTPAIWLTDSLCGIFGDRQGRPNKVMRSAPVIAGLMLASHCLLALLRQVNRQMKGDCLIVVAEA
jgi:SAM-dependent methyltransferase